MRCRAWSAHSSASPEAFVRFIANEQRKMQGLAKLARLTPE